MTRANKCFTFSTYTVCVKDTSELSGVSEKEEYIQEGVMAETKILPRKM